MATAQDTATGISSLLRLINLGGNVLAAPAAARNDAAQSEQMRALLTSMGGMTPDAAAKMAPAPSGFEGWLNPDNPAHSGLVGRLLAGTGGLGSLVKSALGEPLAVPRVDMSTFGELAKLQAAKEAGKAMSTYRMSQLDLSKERNAISGRRADESARHDAAMEAKAGASAGGPAEYRAWAAQQPAGADDSIQAFWNAKGATSVDTASKKTQATQDIREQTLTAATRTMIERAPAVITQAQEVRKLLDDRTGPFAGRMDAFRQGRIGMSDPGMAKLQTALGLLRTQLGFMHFGARGAAAQTSDQMKELVGSMAQDPKNIEAKLEEVEKYAKDVMRLRDRGYRTGGRAGGVEPPGPTDSGTSGAGGSVRDQHPEWFTQ